MFKNRARIDAFRPHAVPQKKAPAYGNDNRPGHDLAASKRAERPRLACHWGAAGGRLECHWQTESDETTADVPGLSSTKNMPWRLVDGLLGLAMRGKPAVRVAMV
jgi:hypothetical protein